MTIYDDIIAGIVTAREEHDAVVASNALLAEQVEVLTAALIECAPPPRAFPSAEGFGAATRGAYAGSPTPSILHVTNLNDSGAGSLRAALQDPNPRIVIVDVDGYVDLQTTIKITSPYLTYAGQTAPAGGLCVRYASNFAQTSGPDCIRVEAHDVVIRHLKVRPGLTTSMPAQGQGIRVLHHDVIIDHCSLTWGHDENGSDGGANAYNITWQWNILGECLAPDSSHGRCLNHTWETATHVDISDHHNVMMRARFRVPQVSTDRVEVINDCIFGTVQQGMNFNCYPNNLPSDFRARYRKNWYRHIAPGAVAEINIGNAGGADPRCHAEGNLSDPADPGGGNRTSPTQSEVLAVGGDTTKWTADPLAENARGPFAFPTYPVTEEDAPSAYARMVPAAPSVNNIIVGACKPAVDATDLRMITYFRNGTRPTVITTPLSETEAGFDARGYPPLATGSPRTVPANPHTQAINAYTNIENWMNALAGDDV